MSKYFNQTHKVGFAILVSIAFLFACKTEKVEWIEIDAGDGVYEYYTVLKSDSDYKDGPFFKIENKTDTIEKGMYVANQLDGQRVLYYPGGQVKIIENYIEGIYSGSYLSYYENGALKQSASFENNQMNGELKNFYEEPQGQIKESFFFKDGIEDGPYKIYYENGQLEEEGIYVDGLKNGAFKEYYEDGTLHAEGKYLDDYEDGEVHVFDSTGVLTRVYVFENKKIVETIKQE